MCIICLCVCTTRDGNMFHIVQPSTTYLQQHNSTQTTVMVCSLFVFRRQSEKVTEFRFTHSSSTSFAFTQYIRLKLTKCFPHYVPHIVYQYTTHTHTPSYWSTMLSFTRSFVWQIDKLQIAVRLFSASFVCCCV